VASEHLTPTLPSGSPPSTPSSASASSHWLSPSTIHSGQWLRYRVKAEQPSALGAVLKTLVGVAAGGLAYAWGAERLAIIIWAVAGLIGVVALSSQKARSGVGWFFAALGRGLGWLMGVVLLAPLFLIGFTAAHVIGRLAGRDPLHLRDKEAQTFWLAVDQDRRKVRHVRSLFATETPAPTRGGGVIAAISLVALLVTAEIVLRTLGFGSTILYQPDNLAGYFPAPNQEEHRYGGKIITNSHGMRAPEFAAEKPAGTLRILMLGDSTLYGGSYIDQNKLYARLVDNALDLKPGANDVEVLNMAANGWGPFNELGYVEKYGTFDADVAVILLPIGDIYRDLAMLVNLPYFTVDSPPRLALEEVGRHLYWRSYEMFRPARTTEEQTKRAEQGIRAYVELAEKLREQGCEVIFEVLPSESAGLTNTAPANEAAAVDALRAALAVRGIEVGFPVGLFRDAAGGEAIYKDRSHLHNHGHELYAKYLAERLKEQSAKLRTHVDRWGTTAAAEGGTP
jgi:hypothetical protein